MRENRAQSANLNEGIRTRELRSCLLCGTEGKLVYQDLRDRLFGAGGVWSLMRCPKCGLVWLNPQPVSEDIGRLYENYGTHNPNIGNYVPRFSGLRKAIRDALLASHLGYSELTNSPLQKVLGRVLNWVGPIREIAEYSVRNLEGRTKGKLLDIGCGNGLFLSKMRELGWEVTGVEPDGQAVKVARECFNLDVYEGSLEEAGFPDEAFDAITINHVIEHLPDPVRVMAECRRVLKPGGQLVVTTPNILSFGHQIFRSKCYHLDPPRHLYLFSPRTLQICIEQAGLKVQRLWTTSRMASSIWLGSRLIKRYGYLASVRDMGPWRRFKGIVFLVVARIEGHIFRVVEYALCRFGDLGEENVLIATK